MSRSPFQHFFRIVIAVAAVLPLFVGETRAQESAAFKIGFLLGDSEGAMRPVMEQLRESLLANEPLMEAMRARGYSDIWLRPSDEPFDMIQRLGAREFDLAFATSVIYARQFRTVPGETDVFQAVAYEPVFQFRRLVGDIVDPRGNGVFRRGVIFAGPGCFLFSKWPTDEARIAQTMAAIGRESIAVSDSYSAASYIYPRLRIADEYSTLTLRGALFCKSETSVVKHVVAGLANIGACDVQTLADMSAYRYCRELLRTDPIPTDPILMRVDILPGVSEDGMGRELKVALQNFFNSETPPIEGVKVEKASRRAFEDMARALKRFDALQEASEAEVAPRP